MELLPDEIPGLRMRVNSKAGVTTSTHVQLGKQFNIVLDMGQCDEELAGSGVVFISRSTLDHVGGIFTHARLRSFMAKDQPPAKYFVPEFCLDQLILAKEAFEGIDTRKGSTLPMEFEGLSGGDVVDLSKTIKMEAFRTKHSGVPSLGYALHRQFKRMKKKYEKLNKDEKKELGMKGVVMTEQVWECLFVYSGDSCIDNVIKNPQCLETAVLVVEVTFIGLKGDKNDTVDSAKEKGHIHLDDFIDAQKILIKAPVLRIVLCNFSMRYSAGDIVDTVSAKLPKKLMRKVVLALEAFGIDDVYMGDVLDAEEEKLKKKEKKLQKKKSSSSSKRR